MSDTIIHVGGLKKSYRMGRATVRVLSGLDLAVQRGEFLAVVGASGSGKSTLLHLMGLLDRPDEGSITLEGMDVTGLPDRVRARLRHEDIGFVFQFYHLLPELNVLENVQLAQMTGPWLRRRKEARDEAIALLTRLGLKDRLRHRPGALSGGERQRVAIARALANHPKLLLADEPTGNLDSKTGHGILAVLMEFNKRSAQTLVMVTHDESLAREADRIVHLRDGKLA